uniref:Lipoprotein n=1 Tax=Panagrellus redivivus TaxID=6233 RepID=A0A7E4V790_PANRE
MKRLLCISLLLYLAIKTACRPPVVIRRLPTLADVNLTAVPHKYDDRFSFYHVKHFVYVRNHHYCYDLVGPDKKWKIYDYKTANKTRVDFYEYSKPFAEKWIKYGWIDTNGYIDEMVSDYDSLFHPQLEVFYRFQSPCPICRESGLFESVKIGSEYSFDSMLEAEKHPYTREWGLGKDECTKKEPKLIGYGDQQSQPYDGAKCTVCPWKQP